MKRILVLMLTLAMILSLAACGDKDKKKGEPDGERHDVQTDVDTPKAPAEGITYDFSTPEEDLENAPGYQYFVQELPVQETGMTTLLTTLPDDEYYNKISDEIKKVSVFDGAEIKRENLGSQTMEITDENGETTQLPPSNDYIVYVQDTNYIHEIDVAVYADEGYNYLTYGSMQQVDSFENWAEQLDISQIPELTMQITGLTITKDDIETMLTKIQELKTELPDQAIYMMSITDPASYNSIQVALLPYEEYDTIGITASRYIETPFEVNSEDITNETLVETPAE